MLRAGWLVLPLHKSPQRLSVELRRVLEQLGSRQATERLSQFVGDRLNDFDLDAHGARQ
jgi:hypothetical protein